jgi:hypothetical protein
MKFKENIQIRKEISEHNYKNVKKDGSQSTFVYSEDFVRINLFKENIYCKSCPIVSVVIMILI